jgi:hypothetical protein
VAATTRGVANPYNAEVSMPTFNPEPPERNPLSIVDDAIRALDNATTATDRALAHIAALRLLLAVFESCTLRLRAVIAADAVKPRE